MINSATTDELKLCARRSEVVQPLADPASKSRARRSSALVSDLVAWLAAATPCLGSTEGQALFGEYFNIFEGDGGDLRIEIANFGFTDIESAGSRHQSAREHFSAEEIAGAQQLIESYFSNPGVALETWRGVPDVKFLGDVRFRPDWIIRELSDD